jgi:hypothetical protein
MGSNRRRAMVIWTVVILATAACGTTTHPAASNAITATTTAAAATTPATVAAVAPTTAASITPATTANQPLILQATPVPNVAAPGSTVVILGRCTWFNGGPVQWAHAYLGLSKYDAGGPYKVDAFNGAVDPRGDGSFTIDIAIPANAPPGDYHGTLQCGVDDMVRDQLDLFAVTITSAVLPATTTAIPVAVDPLPVTP